MKRLGLFMCFSSVLLLVAWCRLQAQTITTFDVPGDVYGTYPYMIIPDGTITGEYCDATLCHGFLRSPRGAITTFDVRGAGGSEGTHPYQHVPCRDGRGILHGSK